MPSPAKRLERDLLAVLFGKSGLVRKSRTAMYAQLEGLLRDRILSGELKPLDRLPTEKELQEYLGVSRVTVRTAMENLVRDGLISRCRGRGTIVSPPKIEVDLLTLGSFSAAMQQRGHRVRVKVTTQEITGASQDVAVALGVKPGEAVCHVERIPLVDDERIVHFDTWLLQAAGLDPRSRLRGSLYTRLSEAGFAIARTEEFVEAVMADNVLAHKLGVHSGLPLLRKVRHGFLGSGLRFEYTIGHYRGDRYRYRLVQPSLPGAR